MPVLQSQVQSQLAAEQERKPLPSGMVSTCIWENPAMHLQLQLQAEQGSVHRLAA